MPRSLKIYITGVVTLSALALVVATLVFDADKKIALLIGQGTARSLEYRDRARRGSSGPY